MSTRPCFSERHSKSRGPRRAVLAAAVAGLLAVTAQARAGDLSSGANALTLTPSPSYPAVAQNAAPAHADAAPSDWSFVTRLGIWATSLNGKAGPDGRTSDVDMSFSDILDNMNFAAMPGFELGYDKWVLAFNGVFSQLESSETVRLDLPGGSVFEGGGDITVDMYIADLALGYEALNIPLGGREDVRLVLVPAVGVRYTYLSLDINPDRSESRDASQDWWDPYVGGRALVVLSPTLGWRTDASVGGFGVGSDFTWSAQTMLDWRFHGRWELNLGYRALYQDYDSGGFKWDMTMHGPWVGVSVHWK